LFSLHEGHFKGLKQRYTPLDWNSIPSLLVILALNHVSVLDLTVIEFVKVQALVVEDRGYLLDI